MKTISKVELARRIELHNKWLRKDGGERLVLIGCDLSYSCLSHSNLSQSNLSHSDLRWSNLSHSNLSHSELRYIDLRYVELMKSDLSHSMLSDSNLSYSNLRGCDLTDSNLRNSNLQQTRGLKYAQCSFYGHGNSNRQLTGVIINNEARYLCGCFRGSEAELLSYIENGEKKYYSSRMIAFSFIKARLDEMIDGENDEKKENESGKDEKAHLQKEDVKENIKNG